MTNQAKSICDLKKKEKDMIQDAVSTLKAEGFTAGANGLNLAYQTAENKGLDIIGIFHSHPNSIAVPSETDKKFMQSNPVTWVIYSGIERNFHAFILESKVKEIEIIES